MFQAQIQPINAEDLPVEEFRFIKAQVAIANLCDALEQDDALKAQLASAETPQTFFQIAAKNGYEFSISDLEDTLRLTLEQPDLNFDEFDDYELSEDELETVAGGTVFKWVASRFSYWHDTGIRFDGKCFYLDAQSSERRTAVLSILGFMEECEFKGNGEIVFRDKDGNHRGESSVTMKGFIYGNSFSNDITKSNSDWEVF